ncbi:hypothetical protein GCM10010433_58040 [Streptomyces pulveraceus]
MTDHGGLVPVELFALLGAEAFGTGLGVTGDPVTVPITAVARPDQRNFLVLRGGSSLMEAPVRGPYGARVGRSRQRLLTPRLAYLLVTTSSPGSTCGSTVLACRRTCPM